MTLRCKIPLPLYATTVELVITDNMTAELQKLARVYNLPQELPEATGLEGLLFYVVPKLYHVIIDQRFLTHNTIAHELYHATHAICENRSIEEEESQAWLMGYLSAKTYQFIDKKKQAVRYE